MLTAESDSELENRLQISQALILGCWDAEKTALTSELQKSSVIGADEGFGEVTKVLDTLDFCNLQKLGKSL